MTVDYKTWMSRSFDAGNYANAYTSTELDVAWKKVRRDALNRNAFVVGFFSSYETREVPAEHRRELIASRKALVKLHKAEGALGATAGPRKVRLPRWNDRRGGWVGGDSRTLYAFTDRITGGVVVEPGRSGRGHVHSGPNADVTVATRAQAEKHWQDPLHSGWNVAP